MAHPIGLIGGIGPAATVVDDRTLVRLAAAGAGLRARGAAAVLPGRTDLSLASDGAKVGYPVMDGTVVRAEAIEQAAMAG